MMIDIMRCPICGTKNNREYYTGPFGVEEYQYTTKAHIALSAAHLWIWRDNNATQ